MDKWKRFIRFTVITGPPHAGFGFIIRLWRKGFPMSSPELLGPFMLFAFVSSITPGPNNIMLLSSGINFGVSRTLPHMAGVASGFFVMLLSVGLGLGVVFEIFPWTLQVLRWVGAAYLLYLAWKIGGAVVISTQGGERSNPITFMEAVLFQVVNPKAWMMATSAMSLYTSGHSMLAEVLPVSVIYVLIGIPTISLWVVFGAGLSRVLNQPLQIRVFNLTMAALLVASLIPLAL